MSDSTSIPKADKSAANSISEKLNAGIIGLVLGAGGTYLAMIYGGYQLESRNASARVAAGPAAPAAAHGPAFVDPAAPGMGPMHHLRTKRQLVSLVGKLDLCSREDLRLSIKFDADQASKLAVLLMELETAETMTEDEALSRLKTLQGLLTTEQSDILNLIELPRPEDVALIGMPPPPPHESPFAHGMARNRLQALLGRLPAAAPEDGAKAPQ